MDPRADMLARVLWWSARQVAMQKETVDAFSTVLFSAITGIVLYGIRCNRAVFGDGLPCVPEMRRFRMHVSSLHRKLCGDVVTSVDFFKVVAPADEVFYDFVMNACVDMFPEIMNIDMPDTEDDPFTQLCGIVGTCDLESSEMIILLKNDAFVHMAYVYYAVVLVHVFGHSDDGLRLAQMAFERGKRCFILHARVDWTSIDQHVNELFRLYMKWSERV